MICTRGKAESWKMSGFDSEVDTLVYHQRLRYSDSEDLAREAQKLRWWGRMATPATQLHRQGSSTFFGVKESVIAKPMEVGSYAKDCKGTSYILILHHDTSQQLAKARASTGAP